jgi:hypothetical protein
MEMLFRAKEEVVYGVQDWSGSAVGRPRGAGETAQVAAAAEPSNARLELLAEVWARQTGRRVVVAPAARA